MTTEIIERPKKAEVQEIVTRPAGPSDAQLGLYEMVADAGELNEEELAVRAGMAIGAARGWLESQYRDGYMDRDAITLRYRLWCPTPGF